MLDHPAYRGHAVGDQQTALPAGGPLRSHRDAAQAAFLAHPAIGIEQQGLHRCKAAAGQAQIQSDIDEIFL